MIFFYVFQLLVPGKITTSALSVFDENHVQEYSSSLLPRSFETDIRINA